jgi:copper resistance protein D
MNILFPLFEIGNYLAFSILVGHVALQFVPDDYKPKIKISKRILLLSTLGIFIFNLGPVLLTISYFSEGVGLIETANAVLTDFQVGRAWLFIGYLSVFLWMTIMLNGSKYLQGLWLFLMVFAVGYSSHVASQTFMVGLFAHSAHFLIVTLWTGILLHVTWFSNDQRKWPPFLRWFTPFAIACIIVISISGVTLMINVVEPKDYVKSWVLPYGQMLLLKHISIIPVLLFAYINGVLAKKAAANPTFNPRHWMVAETFVIFIVFYFTSVLGMLSPPHEVEFTVRSEGASKWVEWLLGGDIVSTLNIGLTIDFFAVLLLTISFLFLALIFISFKKIKPVVAVFFGCSFIVALYFGLMFSMNL